MHSDRKMQTPLSPCMWVEEAAILTYDSANRSLTLPTSAMVSRPPVACLVREVSGSRGCAAAPCTQQHLLWVRL